MTPTHLHHSAFVGAPFGSKENINHSEHITGVIFQITIQIQGFMSRESSPEHSSELSSQRQARFLPGFEFARITFERHNLEQLRLPLKFAQQLAGHEPTEVGLQVAGCARCTWPIA
jgi:hypothetical protein